MAIIVITVTIVSIVITDYCWARQKRTHDAFLALITKEEAQKPQGWDKSGFLPMPCIHVSMHHAKMHVNAWLTQYASTKLTKYISRYRIASGSNLWSASEQMQLKKTDACQALL